MVEVLAQTQKIQLILLSFLKNLFSGGEDEIPDFSSLKTDVHSHLIAGLDDGAPNDEASVALAKELVRLGYTRAVTTPHIISDSYKNSPANILPGLERLKNALQLAGVPLEVEAAAEYYVDEVFAEMIQGPPLLSFGGDKRYVLFETSYVNRPLSLATVIFEMQTRGYTPVLAHPERYTYFWNAEFAELEALYGLGLKFQVNTSSFAGDNGERAGLIAGKLLAADMIDFIGTDIHRPRQAEGIRRAWQGNRELRRLVNSGRLLNAQL